MQLNIQQENIFRKTNIQIIYFFILIIFNIAYNLISFFALDIIQIPFQNNSTLLLVAICYTKEYELFKIANWRRVEEYFENARK